MIGLASGGTILGVVSFFVNMAKSDYDKKAEQLRQEVDGKVATMVSQFNTLADHFTKGFLQLNEKQDEIIKSVHMLMSIEKESTLLREMFMRHEEGDKKSIERVHERIDELQRGA
jgi:hypothetical protein